MRSESYKALHFRLFRFAVIIIQSERAFQSFIICTVKKGFPLPPKIIIYDWITRKSGDFLSSMKKIIKFQVLPPFFFLADVPLFAGNENSFFIVNFVTALSAIVRGVVY